MNIQEEIFAATQRRDAALQKLSERERIENAARAEAAEAEKRITALKQQAARQQANEGINTASAAGVENQAAVEGALQKLNALLGSFQADDLNALLKGVESTYARQRQAAQNALAGLESAEIIRLTANLSPAEAHRAERQHQAEIHEVVRSAAAKIAPALSPSELLAQWVAAAGIGPERQRRRGLALIITGIDLNPPPGWSPRQFDPYPSTL